MRACYFVQSHHNPEQVVRLVRTLHAASPGARILVGHDARACALARDELPGSPSIDIFYPPPPIERGHLSLLSPFLRAIELLRERAADYDWLVYLSGDDYPTQPLSLLEARLAGSDLDGYLRFWEAFATQNPWGRPKQGRIRYAYQYRTVPRWLVPLLRLLRTLNGVQSLVHVHLVYGARIGVRARRNPFGPGRVCYAGRQWSTLRRSCAEFLVERYRMESSLIGYYDRCICPDESVVQTILVNAGRFGLSDDDLRYVDFAGSRGGRPRLLGAADLPTLADPRYHFARKFDSRREARVLDLLDARIFAGA